MPEKELVLRQLDREVRDVLPEKDIILYLERIGAFNSERFKRMALEDLMELTDEDKHGKLKPKLAESIPHSKLVNDHKWVFEDENQGQNDQLVEPHISLDKVTESAQRRQCNTAKKFLVQGIQRDVDKTQLLKVETMTSKVESCFRRRGRRARLRFLTRMKKHLETAYGFEGEEIVLRRKALIYWSRDKFDETRKILGYLISESQKQKNLQFMQELYIPLLEWMRTKEN